MNQDTQTKPAFKPRRPVFHYITMGAALLGVFLLWRQQESSQKQIQTLIVRNNGLRQELKAARTEIDDLTSGDSSKGHPDGFTANPDIGIAPETLEMQSPTVTQTAAGLSVRVTFESTTSEPPDSIALVVRVPSTSDARIIALQPTDETRYSDIKTHIDESGKFAVFQGTPADLKTLQFNLTVSAPTKAIIRSTGGIKGVELDITPEQVQSRTL